MSEFHYQPSTSIPFRDTEVLARVRAIRRADIERHPNPDYRIRVVPDDLLETIFLADMFQRIQAAAAEERNVALILPNPNHGYIKLAHWLNRCRVSCRRLYVFNMDEFADQDGNTAPESWPMGFMHAMKKYFYANLDPDLRPPEDHFQGPTTSNITHYGKMIEDLGNADACYSGPGWTGHVAFIEPDAPEFDAPLQEWKRMGPRIVTLSPFTIAQNSLHGSFGMSGDMAQVPPKAATIGPREVIQARYRMDQHGLTVDGTRVSWQRLITRLCLHGPVTPKVPTSLLQELKTDVYVTETLARDIEPIWDKGY